jgi:hypothetical protein
MIRGYGSTALRFAGYDGSVTSGRSGRFLSLGVDAASPPTSVGYDDPEESLGSKSLVGGRELVEGSLGSGG